MTEDLISIPISVPAEDTTSVRELLTDLATDLGLPAVFAVNEGAPQIDSYPVLARQRVTVRDAIFHSRTELVTNALAERVGIAATVLRELVSHGVNVRRVLDAGGAATLEPGELLELALDAAGARTSVRVHAETKAAFISPSAGLPWSELSDFMIDGLFQELGLSLGPCELVVDDRVPPGSFRVQINDLRYPLTIGLGAGEVLVNDTPERTALFGVGSRPAVNPAEGYPGAIIQAGDRAACEALGLTTWDSSGYLILALAAAIRRNAASLLPRMVVDYMNKSLAQSFPSTVDGACEMFTLNELSQVLRGLLSEQVSIRNLRRILETLITTGPAFDLEASKGLLFAAPGSDPVPPRGPEISSLIEGARNALNRQISHAVARGGTTIEVYLLDSALDARLRQDDTSTFSDSFRKAVHEELASLPPTASTPAILTGTDVRARCTQLVADFWPRLKVLSYSDVSPGMNIAPKSRISLSSA